MEDNFNSCNIPRILRKIQSIGYVFILDGNDLKIKGFSKNIPGYLNFSKNYLYKNGAKDIKNKKGEYSPFNLRKIE